MLKIIQLVEDKLEIFITTLRKYHFEKTRCVCGIHVGGWGGNQAMTNGFELVGPKG